MPMESPSVSVDLDKPFELDGRYVDPSSGQVRNGGQTTQLQPQAVEVLQYLAERPGEVVSRNEIEEAVWADRTVGYDALTATMFKLRKALGDDPKSPSLIETLSKRGYRLLVAPQPAVEEADGVLEPVEGNDPPPRHRDVSWGSGWIGGELSVVGVCIAAALTLWVWLADEPHVNEAVAPKNNTIVVLPFKSLGTEAGGDFLADGVTDDLTTALAKIPQLTVISRDSAFVYKGEKLAPSEIGERLNVDFILRGSVRERGEHVRVNIQLVDAAKGRHVWADQFDGSTSDIFDLQNGIITKVATALTERYTPKGTNEALLVRTQNPKAYRAFQLGRQHFYLYINKQENRKARELFAEALKFDPDFAMAHAMLAWTHSFDAMNGWADDRDASLQLALESARKAISLDAELPLPYFVAGLVYRERREYVKAMVEAEKAMAIDPNYANGHVLLATLLYYAGRPAESVDRLKRAMRLNPHHPFNYSFHLGQAYFTLRRYKDAIEALEKGVESNPASERLHLWLAAALAHAGRLDDAQWEAEQVHALNPEFALSTIAKSYPFKDEADRNHFFDGLKKAGLT